MTELDNRLWDLLNRVRGHRDVRDLKELFVSLVFLKYANDKFIENDLNAIEVPKDAQWNYLQKIINTSNFIDVLQKSFFSIENENPKLEGTFSVFNFRNIFKTREDSELVRYLFDGLTDIGIYYYPSEFSNVIENLLINFANNDGKRGNDFTTPESVSQLMIELLNPSQGLILDSACGTGGFFQKIKDNYPKEDFEFYGQEYNPSTLAIAKLRFAFNQENKINFGEPKSTLTEDQFPNLKTDYVIMHPPFNVKSWIKNDTEIDSRFEFGIPPKGNANFAWMQHAIHHLNNKGKAVLLFSNGSLISGGKDGEIRKNIIEADLVEAIVSLPSQLLVNTSIPTSIWLINKNKVKKGKILFIDASDLGIKNKTQRILDADSIGKITKAIYTWQSNYDIFNNEIGFTNAVDLNEIAENDYLLTPARYVGIVEILDIDLSNSISLGDVLEYYRPLRLKSNIVYKRLGISNLSSNPDSYLLNTENLSDGELNSNFRILINDILLIARLGPNLRPTYCKSNIKRVAYSSSSILSFIVDESKISIEYLIAELYKDYIKAQIESFRKGSGIPSVRIEDLLKIKIIVPTLLEQQKEIFEKERELRFQSVAKDLGFEKEIASLKLAQMKDLGSKKHNIMQHLNNVKASTDVLTRMMELNNGILKFDEVIDPRRGVTVEKRFLRLRESLDKVIYYVDNITNELKYDEAEIINPSKFIKECKERGQENDLFSVEIIVEYATFEGREPLINISKNDFEEIYNNILENAINHGFVDKNKSYVFRVTIAYIEDLLEINFINNGKPFPKGIAEKFYIKGEKAGVTAGTGIGLWKVAEITKHFGCVLEVFDEPSSEFPVGFKLKFNIETL